MGEREVVGEYTHACGVVDVFVHFACGVEGENNMLMGLWVGVFTSVVGVWLNTHMLVGLWVYLCTLLVGLWVKTICLWGCGCVCSLRLWDCG